MKNCIPLLGVLFCLTILQNCTNRNEEADFLEEKLLKNKLKYEKPIQDSTVFNKSINDPDPPVKDGDDWIINP